MRTILLIFLAVFLGGYALYAQKIEDDTKVIMSRFIICIAGIFIACYCTSCEETVREELQILIQNRTDSPIYITLYPKAEYLSDGCNLYLHSDIGSGYVNTEFSLDPNEDNRRLVWKEIMFITSDLNIKPYTLASKVFDSIHISSANIDKVIKFTHETVTGYSENIFSENSTWDFIIVERNEQTQFRKNPVRSYCYRFLILKDKIAIE